MSGRYKGSWLKVQKPWQEGRAASQPVNLRKIKTWLFICLWIERKELHCSHYFTSLKIKSLFFLFFGHRLCVGGFTSGTGFWKQNCLRRVTVTAQPPTSSHRHGLSHCVFERASVLNAVFTVFAVWWGQCLLRSQRMQRRSWVHFCCPERKITMAAGL